MKITLKEIAEKAGVSPATVSRVINGAYGVKQEKRDKVKSILEQLPKFSYGRKTSSTTKNIGVLFLSPLDFDQQGVLCKLEVLAKSLPARWNLILLSSESLPFEIESRYLRGHLSGLVLFGYPIESPDMRTLLEEIPHIWMNSHEDIGRGKSVLMGNEMAGRIAASYLIENNCKNSAVLTAPSHNPGFASRIDGFRFEFFSNNHNCTEIRIPIQAQQKEIEICSDKSLEAAMDEILSKESFHEYDGVFSPEERLTPFLYQAMQKKQLKKWPLVISCNYTPEYLAGLYPRPASIDMGVPMLAKLASKELLRRISGETKLDDNIAVITTPKLVPGDRIL